MRLRSGNSEGRVCFPRRERELSKVACAVELPAFRAMRADVFFESKADAAKDHEIPPDGLLVAVVLLHHLAQRNALFPAERKRRIEADGSSVLIRPR